MGVRYIGDDLARCTPGHTICLRFLSQESTGVLFRSGRILSEFGDVCVTGEIEDVTPRDTIRFISSAAVSPAFGLNYSEVQRI